MQRITATKIYVALSALMVAFSTIAFVGPFSRTLTFWCAYTYGALAIMFQASFAEYSFDITGSSSGQFRHIRFSLGLRLYFVTQLSVSIFEMAMARVMPSTIAVAVNALVFALMAFGTTTTGTAYHGGANYKAWYNHPLPDILGLQSETMALMGLCGDKTLMNMLGRISDNLTFISHNSIAITKRCFAKLHRQLEDVRHAIYYGDADNAKRLCGKLLSYLNHQVKHYSPARPH